MASLHTSSESGAARRFAAPLLLVLVGLVVVITFVVVAAITGLWILLAAVGALVIIVGAGLGVMGLLARNAIAHDPAMQGVGSGAVGAASAQAAMAGSFFAGMDDDETALGATTEVHDQLGVHDLPLGSPSRHAIEQIPRGDSNTGAETQHRDRDPTRDSGGDMPARHPGPDES